MQKSFTKLRAIGLLGIISLHIFSSCSQNQTYNRGYVISQTQMEGEEENLTNDNP